MVESVATVDDVLDVDDVLRWCEFVQQYDDALRRELRKRMPGLTDQECIERLRAMQRELQKGVERWPDLELAGR